jgi:hypothetical protein
MRHIGLSVLDDDPQELAYLSLQVRASATYASEASDGACQGVSVELEESHARSNLQCVIEALQVDNQVCPDERDGASTLSAGADQGRALPRAAGRYASGGRRPTAVSPAGRLPRPHH